MAVAFPTLTPTSPNLLTNQNQRTYHFLPETQDPSFKVDKASLQLHHESSSSSNLLSFIESCSCLHLGRQIHAHTVKSGLHGDGFLENRLLVMYGRCCSVDDASWVFQKLVNRNIYSWLGILSAFAENGCFEDALELLQQMMVEETQFEFFIFPIALKICSGLGALGIGKELHGVVIKREFVSSIYVENSLIDVYGKCGVLGDAQKLFDKMSERDCVSWNAMVASCAAAGMVSETLRFLKSMRAQDISPNLVSYSAAISGFVQNGYHSDALELLRAMQADGFKPNSRTLASVLPACARLGSICMGKEIHGYLTRHGFMSNSFVINGLMDVYRRCSYVNYVESLFWRFSVRNLMSFNTMIVGYFESGMVNESMDLFRKMEIYGIEKDRITWNLMISGCVNNGRHGQAFKLFRQMMIEGFESDSFTLGSVLNACADLGALSHGKEIHAYGVTTGLMSDAIIRGALIEMYCRCKELECAKQIFYGTDEIDSVMWNSMISGHARCGYIYRALRLIDQMESTGLVPGIHTWNGMITGCVENRDNAAALQLVSKMHVTGVEPDIYTIGIILPACSRLLSIEQGRKVHAYAIRHGYDEDVYVGSALIDMYAKCGCMKHAFVVFNRVGQHSLVPWNTMLAGYAMHGYGKECIALFHQMQNVGIKPDSVTFLSFLSACAHCGLVDEGWQCFKLMEEFAIQPSLKHYTCMVDLLSRVGQLSIAYELIKGMQMNADTVMWGAFLNGCVVHQEIQLGELAAEKLIELEPCNSGNYVLLANLYALGKRWNDLARTRKFMKDGGLLKNPGCSWTEVNGEVHSFYAGDHSNHQSHEICETLQNLTHHMKHSLHVPDTGCILRIEALT